MLKIKSIILVAICILSQMSLFAQNNTNSPYTRFGYGELADRSFGAGRVLRNALNAAVDSMCTSSMMKTLYFPTCEVS